MNALKKIIMLPVTLVLGLVGCSSGSGKSYVLTTTSYGYDINYSPYIVQVNGEEVGGGFGSATKRSTIISGPQYVKWGEDASKVKHVATNVPFLTKDDLKGKSYLAVHLYPDDSVEITLSSDYSPEVTEKGMQWRSKIFKEKKENK